MGSSCSFQKTHVQKTIDKNDGRLYEVAIKSEREKVEHLVINPYTDSIFPNSKILEFPNLRHLEIHGSWQSRNKSAELCPQKLQFDREALSRLKKLEYLEIVSFDFSEFPEQLLTLAEIRGLSIVHCGVEQIPESISNLSKLEYLDLCLNSIENLPISLLELKHLKTLDLNNNRFKHIPEVLFSCDSLKDLRIGNREGTADNTVFFFDIENNVIDYSIQRDQPDSLIRYTNIERLSIDVRNCDAKKFVRKNYLVDREIRKAFIVECTSCECRSRDINKMLMW